MTPFLPFSKRRQPARKKAAQPSRCFAEPLEPRQLLAGLTVITHGFQSGGFPNWVHTMALAVAQKEGGADIYRLTITGSPTPHAASFTKIQSNTTSNGDSIIEVDWSATSSQFSSSVTAGQVADVVVPYITTYPTTQHPFAELPIHLMGHSRGASVVSSLAKRVAEQGIWLDQLTLLDPHPLTASDLQPLTPVIDPPIHVYDNTIFSDNYYETAQAYPHGESVPGAHNVFLSGSGINHSAIHTYYYGTVDRAATSDGDGGTVQDSWYGGSGGRATVGYNYSLVDAADRAPVADGLSSLAGGSAHRDHAALTTSTPWSNIGSLSISGDSAGAIASGQAIQLNYRYQDAGGGAVNFYIDDNQNPYDGSTALTTDANLPATGVAPNSLARQVPFTWSSNGLTQGIHFLYAAIHALTGQTRYIYMPQPMYVTPSAAEIITKQWTGDAGAAYSDPRNWTPGGLPAANDRSTIQLAPAAHVDLSSGTLYGVVHLLSGTLNWTAGDIQNAAITIAPSALLNISTDTARYWNGSLENAGTLQWDGSAQLFGGTPAGNGAPLTINNLPGALFDIRGDGQFSGAGYSNAPAAFNNSGTLRKSAGANTTSLSGIPVNNSGTLQALSGTLVLTANYTGTGSTIIGQSGTPAQMIVPNFVQQAITINTAGKLTVNAATPHTRNTVGALTIAANGLLDIASSDLVVDNTLTPFATLKSYWQSAYNNDPNAGYGLWNGLTGITSSIAKTSAQTDAKITIGYLDGAFQNDPDIGNFTNFGGPALATNQVLFRPCLMGDLNLDGVVNADDIGLIIGLGFYGKSSAPHGWLDGDLNGDGKVDGDDVGLIIGTGTYNNGSYSPNAIAARFIAQRPFPSPTALAAIANPTTSANGPATLMQAPSDAVDASVVGKHRANVFTRSRRYAISD